VHRGDENDCNYWHREIDTSSTSRTQLTSNDVLTTVDISRTDLLVITRTLWPANSNRQKRELVFEIQSMYTVQSLNFIFRLVSLINLVGCKFLHLTDKLALKIETALQSLFFSV